MTYEEAEDERWREAMRKIEDNSQQSKRMFTAEAFKAAFQKINERRRPPSKVVLMGQTLAEVAGGSVRCGHCDDTCLVESLYDQGPGCCPCFEDCPAIDEPWHVKR